MLLFPDPFVPRFQGPSLTSVFFSYNKYYTRQYLDPNRIAFLNIDISTSPTKKDLEKAIEKVGLPAILKPNGGNGSASIKKIKSLDELVDFVADIQKNYRPSAEDCTAFVAKHLEGKEIVPTEKSEGFLLEQFMETPFKVSVDG